MSNSKARKEANARWRAKHREHTNEYQRERYRLDPKWRNRLRSLVEKRASRRRPEECEVCGQSPTGYKKVLCLDHDHITGEFRGWLCDACNKILGYAKDDPQRLEALASYLRSTVNEPAKG